MTTIRLPILLLIFLACACSDNDADTLGVAAECVTSEDCNTERDQVCLLNFKGGYCGIADCENDSDCPDRSACVAHNGANYCFRICTDKSQCNENRSEDNEANCSSNIDFVDTQEDNIKACVPPSA